MCLIMCLINSMFRSAGFDDKESLSYNDFKTMMNLGASSPTQLTNVAKTEEAHKELESLLLVLVKCLVLLLELGGRSLS